MNNKKKMLILAFYDNGDFKSKMDRLLMHRNMIKALEAEGKEAYNTSTMFDITTTTFQDGSTVTSAGFGAYLRGLPCTHVYIDEKLALNGIGMDKVFTHGNFSVKDNGSNIFTYSIEDEKINIKKL